MIGQSSDLLFDPENDDGEVIAWDKASSTFKMVAQGADTNVDARISNLETRYARITRFESIGTNTSGTLTISTNETIVLDDFGGAADAVVTHVTAGKPDWTPVVDTNGTLVTTTFNSNGAFALSAAASTTNNCVVFRTQVEAKNLVYDAGVIGPYSMDPAHTQLSLLNADPNYQHLTTAQVANVNSYKTYETLAAMKAATGTEPTIAYNEEKAGLYKYCSGCAFPADDDLVTITGNGGNTRWELIQKVSRTQGDTGWINTDNATLTAISSTEIRLSLSSVGSIAIKGVRIPVPIGNYDAEITGTAGVKFVGFNSASLILTVQDSLWDFNTQVPVAVVYWSGTAIVAAPQTEFHGIRDTVWHLWAHLFFGCQYKEGLSFTGSVQSDNNNNPGTNNTVTYLWSTAGIIHDEDAISTPGTGQWAQTLGSGLTSTTAAIFNFFYYNGSFVTTANAMADRSPFLYSGANGTPQWNSGGTLTASVTGDYIVYHYFVTPMVGGWSVFARPHNAKFTSLALAQAARPSQLTWSNYAELKHLYTAVFRVNTGWDTTHRCKLVGLYDYRTIAGTPTAAVNPTAHSGLSGLELAGAGVTHGHVDDQTQTIAGSKTFSGFTVLGAGPAIKMQQYNGTTPNTEGSTLSIEHGITSTKIISINAIVYYSATAAVGPGNPTPEYQFGCSFNPTNVSIDLHPTSSGSILSQIAIITVFYIE
jgi:hypothetical protein